MTNIRLTLTPHADEDRSLELEAPDVATALAVADINVEQGTAELFAEGERIALLTKQGGKHGTFWKVD